ncbi:MAG: hypothetical protein ACKODG_01925, partial [Betaproteobacteria bacterium]
EQGGATVTVLPAGNAKGANLTAGALAIEAAGSVGRMGRQLAALAVETRTLALSAPGGAAITASGNSLSIGSVMVSGYRVDREAFGRAVLRPAIELEGIASGVSADAEPALLAAAIEDESIPATATGPVAEPVLTYGGPTRTGSGSFSLRASGAITVDAAIDVLGGGNLLLDAGGALDVAECVTVAVRGGAGAPSGTLSLIAGQAVTLRAASALLAEGGDIDLESRSGAIAMAAQSGDDDDTVAAATLASQGGNIRLAAAQTLQVSEVDASGDGASGHLSLISHTGSIVGDVGSHQGAVSLIGQTLRLQAARGIGDQRTTQTAPDAVLNPLRSSVVRLSAVTAQGDVRLYNVGELELGPVEDLRTLRASTAGLTAPLWDLEQAAVRTGAGGAVHLINLGTLRVLSDAAIDEGVAIAAGSGGIRLDVRAVGEDAGDLVIEGDIVSGHARTALGGGVIELLVGGSLKQSAGTLIASGAGVEIQAEGEVTLARVSAAPYSSRLSDARATAPAAGARVQIITPEAIRFVGDTGSQPRISAGELKLSAFSVHALVTAIDRLSADIDEGNLIVSDLDGIGETVSGLSIGAISVGQGGFSLNAAGSIVINQAAHIKVADGTFVALNAGANLSLLHSDAIVALEGSISELTLVAAGFVTSARLFTGASRTEYRAGQPLRLGSAARYVDPKTGEITEGAVIVSEPMDAADEPAADPPESAAPMMMRAFSAGPSLVFASDAFISVADALPDTGSLTVSVTAREAVFVADPALLAGVEVATSRFLVTPADAMDAGNEEQTLSDLTDTETALPPITTPVGVLPGGLVVVPDVDSVLVFPGTTAGAKNAFGTGDGLLTLTLTVPANVGVLKAASPGTDAASVVITGSGTRSITLKGTEAALGTYLAGDNIRYNGLAGQTLSITAVRASTAKLGEMSSVASIGLYGASLSNSVVPVIASLPARLWVTAHTSSQLQFPAASLQGEGLLRLTLAVPQFLVLAAGQGLAATPQSGDGVTVVAGSSARTLTLEGSAADLSRFISQAGCVRYTGPAGVAVLSADTPPVIS